MGRATFNKPSGLSWPSTISVETSNSPLVTPSTPVCLILVDASFDCERHFPKALSEFAQTDDDSIHDRSMSPWRCRLPPPQLCILFGLSAPLPVIAQVCNPIESHPLYLRLLVARTSNLQRLMTMGRSLLRYFSSHISPEMSHFSDLQQPLPSYMN